MNNAKKSFQLPRGPAAETTPPVPPSPVSSMADIINAPPTAQPPLAAAPGDLAATSTPHHLFPRLVLSSATSSAGPTSSCSRPMRSAHQDQSGVQDHVESVDTHGLLSRQAAIYPWDTGTCQWHAVELGHICT